MLCHGRALCLALFLSLLPVSLARAAQAPNATQTHASESSYIAAFRTPAHVTRSAPEVFHDAVDNVLDLLKSKNVALAADPSRPMIRTEETMPRETLLNAAKDSGATYLLVLTVDRPLTSWLKISIQCFSISGKPLWEEHASYGGGFSDIHSKQAVENVLKKLSAQLEPRFGAPGLPLLPAAKPSSQTRPDLRAPFPPIYRSGFFVLAD